MAVPMDVSKAGAGSSAIDTALADTASAEGRAKALLHVLREQRDVLHELLDVATRQQQALLTRDRAVIESTTKEQNEWFVALQALEYDREQLLRTMKYDGNEVHDTDGARQSGSETSAGGDSIEGGGLALDPALSFERILRTLPEDGKDALQEARDEARSLLVALSAVTQTNQQLLTQELALFDMYMSVLHPDMAAEGYTEPGQVRKSPGASAVAFDTRA